MIRHVLLLVPLACGALVVPNYASAATLTVFSYADSGPGTLRQAIFDASSGDTIMFAASSSTVVIGLTSGELLINKDLTIRGPGADMLILQCQNISRIFRVAPASVTATISGLKMQSGHIGDASGGGILNTASLTIDACQISGNIVEGSGNGAGIANSGSLTVLNSTVADNAGREGPNFYGGGIYNTGTLTVLNSTISGNGGFYRSAAIYGGGIACVGGGKLTISNSTVAGNGTINSTGCGGGIYIDAVSASSSHSCIIALNTGATGPDVCGALSSGGFNIVGNNASATINGQQSDQIGAPGSSIDPLLGSLQYNGGPTFTRALQSDSPAVNHGDPNSPVQDQRGYYREDVSDIGAFELGATVPISLANISTRLGIGTGNNVLIGGFIITGTQPKKVIVRAIGPSLPVVGVVSNPILEIRNSSGNLIAVNDNWRSDQEADIIATKIAPTNDLESAVVTTLPANNSAYTAIMRGVNNGTGIGVVEIYDLNRTVDAKLGNISSRGLVQTDDNVMIGGFIVVGRTSQKVLVRAIGPSLNLSGKLGDPTLELRNSNGDLVAFNDNWRTSQEAEIIATTIPPSNDLESAIVKELTPGNYTAIVRGANRMTGIALVEAYGLN